MDRLRILGVVHTGITVSDIDRSIAFYRDILGFEVTPKGRYSGEAMELITGVKGAEIDIAFVEAPGHRIELLCYAKPEGRVASTLRPYDPGCLHLAFRVKDIDRVVAAARTAGFEPVNPVQTVEAGPHKGLRAVYTRDPDGVILELLEEPPHWGFERL